MAEGSTEKVDVLVEEEVVTIVEEKERKIEIETQSAAVDLAQQDPTTALSDFGDSDHDTDNLLCSDNESLSTVTHDVEDTSSLLGLSIGDPNKNEQETGGLSMNDANVGDYTKWTGRNILGKVLMEVREELK
jgi:hypothetical protein